MFVAGACLPPRCVFTFVTPLPVCETDCVGRAPCQHGIMIRDSENNVREIFVTSRPEEIGRVWHRIRPLMEATGYGPRDIFGVELAAEEAMTNAMKHGNAGDPTKRVRVAYRVDAAEVWLQIEDEGDGFHIEDVPDPTLPDNLLRPSGRGILLMKTFMSTVEYNERGNCVTLTKVNERGAATC